MAEKTVKSRIQVKRGTSAEWALATNFVPKEGEIIFYSDLNKMKIGDGSTLVSSLPFLHVDKSEIDNWSHNHDDKYYTESEVDTKLSGKAASSHSHGNIASGGTLGTASRVVVTDSNKKITTSSITTTELGYLDGVTSAIQTQLNGKAASGHNHDDKYYTESEIDTKLAGKLSSHNAEVTGTFNVYDENIGYITLGFGQDAMDEEGTVKLDSSAGHTTYAVSSIVRKSDFTGNTYSYGFPDKTGTIALTSDIAANTWRPIGTGATDAAAGNHTHDVAIKTSSGTNELTLAHGTKYALTAGGQSFVFTMPSDNNTNTDRSSVAYCSTASGTAAKTATMPGFALSSGQYILLRTTLQNSATSGVTLNINSTGAKPVKIGTASTAASATNFPAGDYLANYDGTNWILTRIYLTDTTYSSQQATSGGTNVSLVTTGEKYTWNNKASTSVATTSANGLMSKDDKTKLNGIAAGAEVNVQSDWNATSGDAFIKNKPTIPTVNNATLTLKVGGQTVSGNNAFTANDATNTTYNVPSATASAYGVVKVSSVNSSAVTVNSESTTAGRYYPVELNSDGKAIVNVPWTDTNTNTWRPVGTGATDAAAGNHTHDGGELTPSSISTDTIYVHSELEIADDTYATNITPGTIGTSNLIVQCLQDSHGLQTSRISAPTSSGGTTFGFGTSGQVLKSNGSTIYWAADKDTNTHYTTGLYVGATNKKANAATSNGSTYIKLYDDSTKRSEFKITGSGATTVTSDANGNITISSTDTNTNTTYSAGTGLQLSGTTFSTKLNSTTSLGTIGTTSKLYAVGVDANGKLCVNVPWTDTNTNTTYSAGTGISLSGTTFSNSGVRSISTGSTNGTISVNTGGTSTEVAVKGLGSAAYTNSSAYAAASHGTHVTADTVKSALGTGTGTSKYLREDGKWVTPPDTNTTYSLVGANGTTGLIKNGSSVTSTSGLTACPIINGVPYYKDTNSTYSLSSFGITASATELNYVDGVTSNIQTQLDGKAASNHGTHVTFGGNGSATTVSRSDHTHSGYVSSATFDEFTEYAESNYALWGQLGDQVTFSYSNGVLTITSI